jgi:methylmalonyl-CoA/ethylmalonyl-CoA epimerase
VRVHHKGYAIKNIDSSVEEFEKLGYKVQGDKIFDEKRNVCIQFMILDGYLIELISPMNGNSSVNNIISKIGNSPYHICYETPDINIEIKTLLKNGYILLEAASEAIAIENRLVAFLFRKDMGIIELVEI